MLISPTKQSRHKDHCQSYRYKVYNPKNILHIYFMFLLFATVARWGGVVTVSRAVVHIGITGKIEVFGMEHLYTYMDPHKLIKT